MVRRPISRTSARREGGSVGARWGGQHGGAEVERRLERALPQGLGVGQPVVRGLRHPGAGGCLRRRISRAFSAPARTASGREARQATLETAGPRRRCRATRWRPRASAGLMFSRGASTRPSGRATRPGRGTGRPPCWAPPRAVPPGPQEAHRELGIRPVMSQAGQHELPLAEGPQARPRRMPGSVPVDPLQEAGETVGEADARVAVPGGQRHRLRDPVAFLVGYRGSELLRRGVDSGLVLSVAAPRGSRSPVASR